MIGHVNFRPQAIFLVALGSIFACFVMVALLRCCCVAICRRRAACSQSQCCAAKTAPVAPAPVAESHNSEEMQSLVYAEPTPTPFAGGFVYVAPAQNAPTMAPQFVQVYPGQQLYY